MKIKEFLFLKKNTRTIKIVGVVSAIIIINRIMYAAGEYNGLLYACHQINGVLSEEERADIIKRLNESNNI